MGHVGVDVDPGDKAPAEAEALGGGTIVDFVLRCVGRVEGGNQVRWEGSFFLTQRGPVNSAPRARLRSPEQITVVHIRIAIDVGAPKHRVAHAPSFVLDTEQWLVGVHVDDVEEPILVLIAFLADQATLQQFLVRAGEVYQRDLDMMVVVWRGIGAVVSR